jgi:opacity protein-like surface antigen
MLGNTISALRRVACCLMLATLAAAVVPASALAQSQASSGQIAGSVFDSTGGAVVGATVTARNAETGLERSVTTNEDGLFTIVLLPPGTYSLTTSATGFENAVVERIQVTVGRTIDVPVTVGVGGVAEEITVSAGAINVQTTRSEPDAVLNEKAIENLPINGRRFQDFVTLTPTAQVEPSRQQISLAGQRGINANINVDGVDFNNPFFGGIKGGERSNFAFTIPQESIKEFQVVPSGYSAEFGRSTGGIVNAVTKSGTNDFHGSAFYLLRHKEFAKSNEFFDAIEEGDPTTDADDRSFTFVPTQQQFGGSIGGPIKTDRLFFFAAYEQQDVEVQRFVEFSNLNGITPNANTIEAFNLFRANEEGFVATNDAIAFLGRVDWQPNDDQRVNFRYNFSDNEGVNATNTGGAINPITNRAVSNDGTEKNRTHTVIGQWTAIISPTLINEFRGQFAYEERPRLANSTAPNLQVSFGNIGNRNFLPTTQDDSRIQLANNLTISTGNHTIKVGGEYNYVDVFQQFGFNQFGAYNIPFNADLNITLEQLSAGGPTANRFDAGGFRYIRQIGNLEAGIKSHELAFFAQDAWRILPNFTLNLGLRWEGQFNPDPEANNTDVIEAVRNGVYPAVGYRVDPNVIPDATDQWAPRAGFAWDPWGEGRTVIRGFGGIYYARTPALILADPINNFRIPPGNVSITLPFSVPSGSGLPSTLYDQFALIGIDLNSFSLDNLPNVTPEQAQMIAAELGLSPDPFFGASVTVMDPEFENPRSYQAGVGVEHAITSGWTAGVDFTYVNTVNLERNRFINLPAPVVDPNNPAGRPRYFLDGAPRPVPTLRDITVREASAHSLYRALTFATKFQRSWGQFNAFYTLSWNYSDDDNERDSGGITYDNTFDLRPEYNYSNLDRRHQFTANPVFFLPYGFEVSSAIRLLSGTPIDARLGFDANGDFVNNDRPYSGPGEPFLRNDFRNESIYNVDLRVQKRFAFAETQSLVFSVEFFNLFNIENTTISQGNSQSVNYCAAPVPGDCGFSGPTNVNFLQTRNQDPNSRFFGSVITANNPGSPFQAQLGLRYEF